MKPLFRWNHRLTGMVGQRFVPLLTKRLWYTCHMTDVMAAIGLKQSERYPALLKRR